MSDREAQRAFRSLPAPTSTRPAAAADSDCHSVPVAMSEPRPSPEAPVHTLPGAASLSGGLGQVPGSTVPGHLGFGARRARARAVARRRVPAARASGPEPLRGPATEAPAAAGAPLAETRLPAAGSEPRALWLASWGPRGAWGPRVGGGPSAACALAGRSRSAAAAATEARSPGLRPRSKPAGCRRADLTLVDHFSRASRMIGGRSSGHLREARSRGQCQREHAERGL